VPNGNLQKTAKILGLVDERHMATEKDVNRFEAIIERAIKKYIESKIMFLSCVSGRRSMTIRLPRSGLAINIILASIEADHFAF
jgi:hypothetical protein